MVLVPCPRCVGGLAAAPSFRRAGGGAPDPRNGDTSRVRVGALVILVWSSFDPVGVPAVVLATSSLLVIMCRLAITWRENSRLLRVSQDEAITDPLTGLRNRRALATDLERRISRAGSEQQFTLVMFDLDGFKTTTTTSAIQPATRCCSASEGILPRTSRHAVRRTGWAAMNSAPDRGQHQPPESLGDGGGGAQRARRGLYDRLLLRVGPAASEAHDSESALRIADQRMYAQKRRGRASASRQSTAVLLRALAERNPDLGTRLRDVAALATATAKCSR